MSNILEKMKLKILLSVLLFALINSVNAQTKYANEYEKQGDKQMQLGNYTQALDYYMLGRKFVKQNLNLMYKCGEACLKMHDYDKAEYWYQKVLIENDTININKTFPDLYLHLAQSSICNGNVIQAQSFLNTCLMDCDDINIRKSCKKELERIDWIIDNEGNQDYIITNLGKNINDETSQINTFIIKDSILLFTNPDYKTKKYKDKTYYTDIYNQIYYSFIDDDYYTPAKKLDWGEINKKKTDISDFFFDSITSTAYFTYSKTKNNKTISAIYYSVLNNDKWSKPSLFKPLEDKNYSYSHPVIARYKNECVMYFASDRQGGYGNMDLWYIDMNDINAKPVNLGPTVNTNGNEITPFYLENNEELYFSSDTHLGFGGFDIFKTIGWKQRWQQIENLLQPINSSANDMYPFICKSESIGYFTSNRPNDNNKENKTCCNDIYRFNEKLNERNTMQIITEKMNQQINPTNYLPITLYFHNDSPDAGSMQTTTTLTYEECYKNYFSLSNLYKVNRTKGLDDSLAAIEIANIENFFINKLQDGYNKLNIVLEYVYDKLKQGENITIQLKGYSSSLYNTDYNHNLALRRISSVENYMKHWNGGVLKQYMEKLSSDGLYALECQYLAIGKLESSSPNPENVEEKRKSIYLPSAMDERRIEIQFIIIR